MDDIVYNPFSATSAADFTDEQIHDYWVDLADGSGFLELIKPRSEMPMLILGGKGSGKTHIMRNLSFPLQCIRHAGKLAKGIQKDGYVGIYMRCGGLDAARFRDKGQSAEVWASVFAYNMELWLAQMVIDTCREVVRNSEESTKHDPAITREVRDLFDNPTDDFPGTLQGVSELLRALRKELDVAINDCVIDNILDVKIRITQGNLIFGIPQVLSKYIPTLKDCLFVYLIDEFENLKIPQQKFINTLLREKQSPCSFKVGARLYGVRTYATYSAGEEIVEGSEYERLALDVKFRKEEGRYASFTRRLVIKRLVKRGVIACSPETDERMEEFLSAAFEEVDTEGLAEHQTQFVVEKYAGRERPYFKRLRQALEQGIKANVTPGVSSSENIELIIQKLKCSKVPLLEKLNCFIFYQQWSSKKDLREAADSIDRDCQSYLKERNTESKHHDRLLHFKYDFLAQLRRECNQKHQYAGFETFVELSWGNPRHLLILLKHVFSWATFKGERPFSDKPISIGAQIEGVKEASEWFFRDLRIPGPDKKLVHDAINRIGTLFRSIRYSDKPSECSLSAFSYEESAVSPETRRLIDLAVQWSLLVSAGGQRDRNSKRVDVKLQLNRILAPYWDISFSRRGVLPLPGDEVDAIFDPASTHQFKRQLEVRVARMTAPFFGARLTKSDKQKNDQRSLPGLGND